MNRIFLLFGLSVAGLALGFVVHALRRAPGPGYGPPVEVAGSARPVTVFTLSAAGDLGFVLRPLSSDGDPEAVARHASDAFGLPEGPRWIWLLTILNGSPDDRVVAVGGDGVAVRFDVPAEDGAAPPRRVPCLTLAEAGAPADHPRRGRSVLLNAFGRQGPIRMTGRSLAHAILVVPSPLPPVRRGTAASLRLEGQWHDMERSDVPTGTVLDFDAAPSLDLSRLSKTAAPESRRDG